MYFGLYTTVWYLHLYKSIVSFALILPEFLALLSGEALYCPLCAYVPSFMTAVTEGNISLNQDLPGGFAGGWSQTLGSRVCDLVKKQY